MNVVSDSTFIGSIKNYHIGVAIGQMLGKEAGIKKQEQLYEFLEASAPVKKLIQKQATVKSVCLPPSAKACPHIKQDGSTRALR